VFRLGHWAISPPKRLSSSPNWSTRSSEADNAALRQARSALRPAVVNEFDGDRVQGAPVGLIDRGGALGEALRQVLRVVICPDESYGAGAAIGS
jgi:hypothetical protein